MRREAIEEGRRWLEQASEDLKWAKDLAERGGYHIACFLAQQIGEKALKAFLYAQGEEIVVGHSVERLCHQAAMYDRKFEDRFQSGQSSTAFTFLPGIQTACVTAYLPGFIRNMLPLRL